MSRIPSPPPSLTPFRIPSLPPTAYYIPSFLSPDEETHLLLQINAQPRPKWRVLSRRRLQAWPGELSRGNVLFTEKKVRKADESTGLPEWLDGVVRKMLGFGIDGEQDCDQARERDALSDPEAESRRQIEIELQASPKSSSNPKTTASSPAPPPAPKHIFHSSPHRSPTHCLINEYLPGQGIFPHEDGEAYFPVVCTVTLGGCGVLELYSKKQDREEEGGEEEEEVEEKKRKNRPRYRILYEPGSLLITSEELYTDYLHGISETTFDENLCPPTPQTFSQSDEEGKGISDSSGSDRSTAIGIANWDLLGNQESWIQNGGRAERQTRVSLTFRDVLKVKEVDLGGRICGGRQ